MSTMQPTRREHGMSDYRRMEESIDISTMHQSMSPDAGPADQELLTLNIGPHHPATHGVLRLLTTLEGEVIRDVKPIIGYVHTGIEKTAEDKNYWKAIPVVERMDYLAYFFNAMAFCGATETLLDLEVPKRGQYLRVIHLELNRIMSHLVWLGTSALDLGAISMSRTISRSRAGTPSCASSSGRCRAGSTSTPRCSTRTRSCCGASGACARWARPSSSSSA